MIQSTRTTSGQKASELSHEIAAECGVKFTPNHSTGFRYAARRAFSLIEIVLVLVLMLALAAIAVPAVNWILDSFAQKQVLEMVQAAALEARAEVMRQGTAAQLTVVEESSLTRDGSRKQGHASQQVSSSKRATSVVLRFAPQTHENMFTDPDLLVSVDEDSSASGSLTKKGRTQSIFELPPGWRILNRLPTQALLPPAGDVSSQSQSRFVMDDESTLGGSPIVLAILLPSGEVGSKDSLGKSQHTARSASGETPLPFAYRNGSDQSEMDEEALSDEGSLSGSSLASSRSELGRQARDLQVSPYESEETDSNSRDGLYLIGPKGQAWLMSFSRWTGELVMKEVAMSDRLSDSESGRSSSGMDRGGSGGSGGSRGSGGVQEEMLNASSDSASGPTSRSASGFEPTTR